MDTPNSAKSTKSAYEESESAAAAESKTARLFQQREDIKVFIKTMHFKAKIVADDDVLLSQKQLHSKLRKECQAAQEALEKGEVKYQKNIQKYKEGDAEKPDVSFLKNTITN